MEYSGFCAQKPPGETKGFWGNDLVALIDDADYEWLVSPFYCEDFVQKKQQRFCLSRAFLPGDIGEITINASIVYILDVSIFG